MCLWKLNEILLLDIYTIAINFVWKVKDKQKFLQIIGVFTSSTLWSDVEIKSSFVGVINKEIFRVYGFNDTIWWLYENICVSNDCENIY